MTKKIVQRTIYSQVFSHLEKEEITLVIGPRQVGKTTLILQIQEDLLIKSNMPKTNVFYFNLDVVSDRVIFKTQTECINFIEAHRPKIGKLYLFVDEVQRIDNPGIFFKGIYDLRLPLKLILTGSSSLEIRSKIIEPLTGRKRMFTLLPLSFYEYISFAEQSLLAFLEKNDSYSQEKLFRHLSDFIVYGGYPKLILEPNHAEKVLILDEIFTSYLEKDVVNFFQIRDSYLFTQLVHIFAEEISGLLNIEKLSRELGTTHKTVARYLSILENTYLLKRLSPWFFSTRTAIRKMPKIFFQDTGIRNYAKDLKELSSTVFTNRYDKGKLLENFVYSELTKSGNTKIHFWRTKDGAEVDFIVEKKGRTIPIEVKAERLNDSATSRSFLSFISRFNPMIAIWINLGYIGIKKIEKTEVHYMLPYQLIPFIESL